MLVFPNCKINLGLYVTEKRADGFHNIETIFYPVNWTDAIEVLESDKNSAEKFILHWCGQNLNIPLEEQLIYKAWKLVNELRPLPPIEVHFLKNIPFGAGLGGGSSDAVHTIHLLDKTFDLGLSLNQKLEQAAQLGSDCAFFIKNTAQYATGRGEILEDCKVDLSSFYLLLVYPEIHCDTAFAYKSVEPLAGRKSLQTIVQQKDPASWRAELVNDFEKSAFEKHPLIAKVKRRMYEIGAEYASMSGSGSTVFGIFKSRPDTQEFKLYRTYLQQPAEKVF